MSTKGKVIFEEVLKGRKGESMRVGGKWKVRDRRKRGRWVKDI